jgi:hypothetical protein
MEDGGEGRAYPNVTSPSFLLSARREILKEVMAEVTNPAFASASTGVSVCCWDRDCIASKLHQHVPSMRLNITYRLSETHDTIKRNRVGRKINTLNGRNAERVRVQG